MSKINLCDILSSHGRWSQKSIKSVDYLLGSFLAWLLPRSKKQSVVKQLPRQILVIRPGGIGDAVFLLPILKVLRSQGINVEILCESRNGEVFTSQGYIVHFYHQIKGLREIFSKKYDAVIDTEQWHYLSAVLGYFLKTEYRVGFATRSLRSKLFNQAIVYGEREYELANFINLFKGILSSDSVIQDISHSFDVSADLKLWATQQIPLESATVFLGGSISLRRLSQEQLEIILKGFLSKGICPVLLGGADVRSTADDIMQLFKGQTILNYVGTTFLSQSAALIARSRSFIGPDSGLTHLACAVGTPVTAIFGPGDLLKWQPQGNQHKILTEHAACSPCTKFGYTIPTCHGSYHCVKNIKL